jgi:hypothetical protein
MSDFLEKLNQEKSKLYKFERSWGLLFFIIITYSCFEIPLNLVFSYKIDSIFYINSIINLIFLIDIFVQTFLSYKKSHLKGLKNYFFGWFFIDFVSSIPFEILAHLDFIPIEYNFLTLIKALRLLRLLKLIKLAQQVDSSNFGVQSKARIALLIYTSLILAHWISIIWIFVGGVNPEEDPITRYNLAIYWTITTLTTIGYGDITPQNNIQRMVAMLVQIIGAALYGFIIGNISNYFSNIDHAKTIFTEKIVKIQKFMKLKNISKELQEEILEYYYYIWDNKQGYDENELMGDLPLSLKMKVSLYLHKSIFKKIPIFQNASQNLIQDVIINLKPIVYTPNDYIFRKGEIGKSMFFISTGRVQILDEDTGNLIVVLNEGSYFGEISLIQSIPRTATAVALDYCDLYYLEKDTFDKVITNYPEFHKEIQRVAHSRIQMNNKNNKK